MLLCTLALACAATGNPPPDSPSDQAAQPRAQASDTQISGSGSTHHGHQAAILSREEADSLSIRGDSLLAQSDVGDIKVGSVDGNDLVYILVVVLLVVVILAVIR
jgi:hypothetical protein